MKSRVFLIAVENENLCCICRYLLVSGANATGWIHDSDHLLLTASVSLNAFKLSNNDKHVPNGLRPTSSDVNKGSIAAKRSLAFLNICDKYTLPERKGRAPCSSPRDQINHILPSSCDNVREVSGLGWGSRGRGGSRSGRGILHDDTY